MNNPIGYAFLKNNSEQVLEQVLVFSVVELASSWCFWGFLSSDMGGLLYGDLNFICFLGKANVGSSFSQRELPECTAGCNLLT